MASISACAARFRPSALRFACSFSQRMRSCSIFSLASSIALRSRSASRPALVSFLTLPPLFSYLAFAFATASRCLRSASWYACSDVYMKFPSLSFLLWSAMIFFSFLTSCSYASRASFRKSCVCRLLTCWVCAFSLLSRRSISSRVSSSAPSMTVLSSDFMRFMSSCVIPNVDLPPSFFHLATRFSGLCCLSSFFRRFWYFWISAFVSLMFLFPSLLSQSTPFLRLSSAFSPFTDSATWSIFWFTKFQSVWNVPCPLKFRPPYHVVSKSLFPYFLYSSAFIFLASI